MPASWSERRCGLWESAVIGVDETNLRVHERQDWVHVSSTEKLTLMVHDRRRGALATTLPAEQLLRLSLSPLRPITSNLLLIHDEWIRNVLERMICAHIVECCGIKTRVPDYLGADDKHLVMLDNINMLVQTRRIAIDRKV